MSMAGIAHPTRRPRGCRAAQSASRPFAMQAQHAFASRTKSHLALRRLQNEQAPRVDGSGCPKMLLPAKKVRAWKR
jgi:hypothetical protein